MTEMLPRIEGLAAALEIANMDIDQLMPKRFRHGVQGAQLARGLLWNLRFTDDGRIRPDFVLNWSEYAATRILVAGPNFGRGRRPEHAVWGLQQFGIQAVVASSFGGSFLSSAKSNHLLAVLLQEADVLALQNEIRVAGLLDLVIDVHASTVSSPSHRFSFTMSEADRAMLLKDRDLNVGPVRRSEGGRHLSDPHWTSQVWMSEMASQTMLGLDRKSASTGA